MTISGVSLFCDKVIEAGWLVAAIAAPLYFNGYTSTVLHADNLAIVRTMAIIMIAAWLVKRIDQQGSKTAEPLSGFHSSLVVPTIILIVVYLVVTATSLMPRISFFGDYARPDGAMALLAYILIFFMLVQGLRSRSQLDRLVQTTVLTSVPISCYAVAQRLGLDPLAWHGMTAEAGRVFGTLGNPVFLGAYLIMVFFLTAGKAILSWRAGRAQQDRRNQRTSLLTGALYALIALTQLLALSLSIARGAWLGWISGVVFFVLLLALVNNRRRLALGVLGLGLAGFVFLLVLNLPNSPVAPLRSVPLFDRLGSGLANEDLRQRVWLWQASAKLFTRQQPLVFPDGSPDRLDPARPFVGYGPDTIAFVINQFSSPDPLFSVNNIQNDRAHNETWDNLLTGGLLGLVANQFLLLCVFLYGLRLLGFIQSTRARNLFVSLWLGLTILGGLAVSTTGNVWALGLAIPAANIAAILFYVGVYACGRPEPDGSGITPTDRILVAAMLAGLFANYAESQLGIAIPATRVLWWMLAALLVVIGSRTLREDGLGVSIAHEGSRARRVPAWVGAALGQAAILGAVISILLFEFVRYYRDVSNPFAILWRGLTFNPLTNTTSFAILGIVLIVWLIGAVLMFVPSQNWRSSLGLTAAVSFIVSLVIGLGLATEVSWIRFVPTPVKDPEDVIRLGGQLAAIPDLILVSLVLLLFLTAIGQVIETTSSQMSWTKSKWTKLALAPIALIGAVGVFSSYVVPTRADVYFQTGKGFQSLSEWPSAIGVIQQAALAVPSVDTYFTELARAYSTQAGITKSLAAMQFKSDTPIQVFLTLSPSRASELNRLDLLYAAQSVLLRAYDLNPLFADHSIELARFYAPDYPLDSPEKQKLADLSNNYYAQALRLNPNSAVFWNEWANFDLMAKQDPDAALGKLFKSLERAPSFGQTYLYFGNAYAVKNDWGQAGQYYQKALAIEPTSSEAESKLAFVFYRQGDLAASIQAYLKYIQLAPQAANLWEVHKNLALIYEQQGDLTSAIGQAERSASLAPEKSRDELTALATRLRAQLSSPKN